MCLCDVGGRADRWLCLIFYELCVMRATCLLCDLCACDEFCACCVLILCFLCALFASCVNFVCLCANCFVCVFVGLEIGNIGRRIS